MTKVIIGFPPGDSCYKARIKEIIKSIPPKLKPRTVGREVPASGNSADVGVGVGSPVDVGVGVGSPVDVGVGVGSPVDVVSEKVKVLQCLTIGVGTDVATYVGLVVTAPGRLVGAVGATDSCLSL